MNNSTRKMICIACACAASALLVASLALPVWKMRMDAPQYQGDEALKVMVYPGKMTGDLTEIQHIQQYAGIRIPDHLPQLQWLPIVLIGAGIATLIAAFLPIVARRRTFIGTAVGICLALAIAAGMAQYQMYKIGHERTRAPLARVQSFTTPLIGDLKFANFNIKSRFGWGSFLIGGAILLQLAGARLSRATRDAEPTPRPVVINPYPAFKPLPSKAEVAAKTTDSVGRSAYEI